MTTVGVGVTEVAEEMMAEVMTAVDLMRTRVYCLYYVTGILLRALLMVSHLSTSV